MACIDLRCAKCGDREDVFVVRIPTTPLERMGVASSAGWRSLHDEQRHVIHFFCSVECYQAFRNKHDL